MYMKVDNTLQIIWRPSKVLRYPIGHGSIPEGEKRNQTEKKIKAER